MILHARYKCPSCNYDSWALLELSFGHVFRKTHARCGMCESVNTIAYSVTARIILVDGLGAYSAGGIIPNTLFLHRPHHHYIHSVGIDFDSNLNLIASVDEHAPVTIYSQSDHFISVSQDISIAFDMDAYESLNINVS